MKKNLIIIVFLIGTSGFSFTQNLSNNLFGIEYKSFSIADNFKKDCILKKYSQHDTLFVEIFSQFDCHKLIGFVQFDGDTLNLNCYNDYAEKSETKYNAETGEFMTSVIMRQPICCGKCGFYVTFKVSSNFKDNPILFNNKSIFECGDMTKFEIIKNDTINMIDKFGMRQGSWMTFYDNGSLASLDTFKNDQIVVGFKFDKTGRTIAKTSWDGYQTMTIESLTDTAFFRDLPKAPEIYRKINE